MNLIFLIISLLIQEPDTLKASMVSSSLDLSRASGVPVRVVSSQDMMRKGAVSLTEALSGVPGTSIKDYGGLGGLKTVSIRNFGTQHTAICYDGINLSDAQNGQVDIGRFNLDNIRQIHVTIGQSDEIFQPARLYSAVGVVSLETQNPDFSSHGTLVKARMSYASFNSLNPYIDLEQKISDKWSVGADASWLSSDGSYPFKLVNGQYTSMEKRLNSDVRRITAEARLRGDMGNAGRIRGKLIILDSERGLPGSVILYRQNPTERLWDKDLTADIRYDNEIGSNWRLKAAADYHRSWNRYLNNDPSMTIPEDDRYGQNEYYGSASAEYRPVPHFRAVISQDMFLNTLTASIPECPDPRRFSSLTALAAQYAGPSLTVTASVLATMTHETVSKGKAGSDHRRLSPAISMSWRAAQGLYLRASVKDGFRIPTFNDLYYLRVGDTNLVPEKAMQTNLGVTWGKKQGKLDICLTADAYYNRVKDKIVAIPTMFIWKMHNVGEVEMAGLELSTAVSADLREWLRLSANISYAFQNAIDVTDPSAKNYGHQIYYTPRNTGSALLSAETKWVNLSYNLQAVGQRWFLPQNIDANRIPGYLDHSICINRTFGIKGTKLRASAEILNLADVNYQIIAWYPMPGRQFRLSLTFTY